VHVCSSDEADCVMHHEVTLVSRGLIDALPPHNNFVPVGAKGKFGKL
jgi:hypothetical protein